ncbi:MAG TPA: choice-of-anchor tandem repeat GloVer-containing protein [Candidatus Acidoferrum sp.]|jgi:uncharacterized repeat protein (TIGR03803 family)|nr:choice-of-anchor tandem repeat GloVer-containing protein [Candidatus Acidoferrum sp.]
MRNPSRGHRWPAAVWLFLSFLSTTSTRSAQIQVLSGHVPSGLARLQAVGPLSPTNRLTLVLGLPLRNREALTNFLGQLYNHASPGFRRYLTPEQFADRFGPTEPDYQALKQFAAAHRLEIVGVHPNRTLLDIAGSAADIEKAFHVTLRRYRHPAEPHLFFAPDAEPSLDFHLPLLTIGGLDDFYPSRPMNFRSDFSAPARSARPGPAPLGKTTAENPRLGTPFAATGSGPRNAFIGRDFRAAYAPALSLDGSGQAVGLFELDGYYTDDIAAYEHLAGLPEVPLVNVLVNAVNGNPGFNNVEVALDIDMAIAMAPGLDRVLIYEGAVPNDVLNRMATDNLARQLSSSWGFGKPVDPTRDQIFQQFAAQGQSMFQAAGDEGAYANTVSPPSDNPFITVVGGTSLTTTAPGGAWASETAWSPSGGGVSPAYSIPAWQQGLPTSSNQASATMRNFPDVACLADGVIWLAADNGEQGTIGGTSASAPLWAGFAALANQQAAAAGQPSLGFINPALYTIGQSSAYPSAFHDINVGNNTNAASPARFFAVPGFDLCTGWGSPAGSNLVAALLSPPVPLRITPATPLTFSGPVHGPFTPAALSLSLTNDDSAPLNWSASSAAIWLMVSPASGTLVPGGPATVVNLALSSFVFFLPAGAQTATVWFTNLNDQSVQSRQVTLAIVTSPSITSQPAARQVLEGAAASFAVSTAPNALLFYQWQFDNGITKASLADGPGVAGAATPTLTLSNVSPASAGLYSVIVSNAAGVVSSSNATLTLLPSAPVLISQPAGQSVLPGQSVTFGAHALGTGPLAYRWLRNGSALNDGANLAGSGTPNLILSNASAADAGSYSVAVSNAFDQVTSTGAVLTVAGVTAPGISLETLYSFSGTADGAAPNGLLQAADGLFYATAQAAGSNSAGTLFQFTPGAAVTPLYSFTGGDDGGSPFSPLLQGLDGKLYGATFQGGSNDNGTIFSFSGARSLATLLSFNITNGDLPLAGLTRGAGGFLYGVTSQGGTSHRGTVFRVDTNGLLSTLYSFSGGADGSLPRGELVQTPDGSFCGATFKGGASGFGTLFRIATSGFFTSLLSFNSTNGAFPAAGLLRASDGMFYGTTRSGGAFNRGTVFALNPNASLATLYSFAGPDGAQPAAPLIQGSDGNLYGTTAAGGTFSQGTLFRLTPRSGFITLAHFDGFNGAQPQAALVQSTDGALYGTTRAGGAYNRGAILRALVSGPLQITSQPAGQTVFQGANVNFELAVSGSSRFSFQWQRDQTNLTDTPHVSGTSSRVLTLNNVTLADIGAYSVVVTNLLGATNSTPAFLQVTSSPPFIVTQPASLALEPGMTATFTVAALGDLPLAFQWQMNGANLTDHGNIFGAATSTLRLTNVTEANNGSYTVVVTNVLGSAPSAAATLTVIPQSAPGTRLATLVGLTGGTDGGTPNGLAVGANGLLYGTTQFGGAARFGSVFSLTTNGDFTTLFSFGGVSGIAPRAAVVQAADGNLYGTSSLGGAFDQGTIFKMSPVGDLAAIYTFTGDIDGAWPYAALAQGGDGAFYGTAQLGGAAGFGTAFRVTPDGSLATLYSFTNGADGSDPVAPLAFAADGNLYGVTGGGTNGYGIVFQLTTNGALTTIYSFTGGTDGSSPNGPLVQGDDGSLYGTTAHSTFRGFQFYGTIFKLTTNGVFSTLYTLNFTDGSYPAAGLTRGSDGNFYGTTHDGSSALDGTLFRVAPNGAFATLVKFDGFNDGAHPAAPLVEGPDGSFYGTTSSGGPGGRGTVFRLTANAAPQITAPPANVVALLGTTASLAVAAFGAPALFYQWQHNGTNLLDGGGVSGAGKRVLTFTNISFANAGVYSVIVSNALGSVTNSGTLVTVVTAPVFQAVVQTNLNVRLAWSAISGQRYQLQFKSSLPSPTWSNLGAPVTATNAVVTVTDPFGSNTQRFYRVLLLP